MPRQGQVEEAVAYLHQYSARQLEYIQTIMDGAVLAAEQVQDKRLEMLEQVPDVSASQIFIDFALTFILESPLAGKILHMMTQKLLLPRLRGWVMAKENALIEIKSQLPRDFLYAGQKITAYISPQQRSALGELAKEIKKLHRYAEILHQTGPEQGPYPYLVAFIKAVREAYKTSSTLPSQNLEASDTPGVSILDLAQSYVSTQRLSILVEQSMFELWIRTGRLSIKDTYQRFSWETIEKDGKVASLSEIKDRHKRYFELLIWTLLLYDHSFTGKQVTTPRQSFTLSTDYVPFRLSQYWLKRFINPETEKPFSETPALKRPDGKPDLDRSIAALGQYMWRIAEAAVKNKATLISSGPLSKEAMPSQGR